jgi:hypothetical protein
LIVIFHRSQVTDVQGQLLNEHCNATKHKYTDTAQLLEKRRNSRENIQNITKLLIMILVVQDVGGISLGLI